MNEPARPHLEASRRPLLVRHFLPGTPFQGRRIPHLAKRRRAPEIVSETPDGASRNADVRRMAALFDLVAPDYDQVVPFFSTYAERFVPWLGILHHHRVLDIGAGRGAAGRQAEALGARVVGVDVSTGMLTRNAGTVCLMDAQRLGFRAASFDVAMSAFSLHLLPDPRAGIAEGARVLRAGGIFGVALGGCKLTPRWDFYGEILGRYSEHAHGEPRMPARAPLGDPTDLLRSSGLVGIEVSRCEIHLPVADSETFLRGEMAHGYRSLFDVLPPGPRAKMELELRAVLDGMARAGGIVVERVATFAKGRRPGWTPLCDGFRWHG